MGLPAEVLAVGRHNARRTGIDEADGISFTAQAWSEHPDAWRTVAHRRCVDERRVVSGRNGEDRRALVIVDETFADGEPRHDFGADDPGLEAVETRVDLAAIIADLSDGDVAILARRYWLNVSPPAMDVGRAMRHARAVAAGKKPAPEGPLTARELQIVALLADGLGNKEIGASLGLATDTIKSHLFRIFARIGANDRAHAVAIAFRAGWIT